MASPLGDSFPFRNPLAESAASIPSLPVTPGGFPALLDAARQQTELVFWIVRTVQEHEGKLQSLSRQLADQLSVTKLLSEDRKTFRSSKSRNWQAGLGNRGLSRESFHSGSLSQEASSPNDMIDTVEDKTHIENLGDISHALTEKDDEALMPVDGVTTATSLAQKEDQALEDEEAPQEGRMSQMDSIEEDRQEPARDSTGAHASGSIISAESPPARRFSFIEGGRRPSTRSLPLQVDPSFAGSLLTEERFADRLEERLQQVLAEDVEHRLEDLAQYIQEEMYHFVLGPDMMERVRQEASNLISIELAVALAAQDKKMEDLVQSRVHSSLSQVAFTPEIPPEALSSLRQASEELNELADGLSKRVKLVEENVSELKGIRLQVPDMRNDINTLQSNLAACVQSIEELEVQQQELVASGAKPLRDASPARQLLSPSGSAADDEFTAEDLAEQPEVAADEPRTSPVPSPSQVVREASPEIAKPKRRLSDMLGLYMPPAPKQPAPEDSQVQELVASTENMKNRLDQMEQLVGTEASSRRNSLQNKINDVDTLASIPEDRMMELDNEFRSNNQKIQSQLDVLLAAHETQQAEDLRHNKTWNLANQVDVILSVINSEMRNLRSDFDQKLSSAIIGKPESKGDGTNEVPKGEVQDLEEKVKRLQDNQQQSMLKIAGLRSAHKHAEAQANFALEKLKRLQAEVGGIVDQVVAQQTRLDYLLVHGAAMQQSKDSSFKTIVSVGEQEKKPKLKGGATMPTRPLDKTSTDAGGPDVAKLDTTSDEVNASRIAKMGKRLLELDGEVNRTVVDLRNEIQTINKTLLAFLELLPRRLRRMLQRQLFPDRSEEDAGEIKVEFKSDEGKRHVTFGDQVETRTYTVEEDDSRLPWQLAGEPDIKWSWCFKPRDEMGRDLAMCLEQFETERDDFEAKIVQWLQHGGVPPPVASKGAPVWSKGSLNHSDSMIASFAEDSAVVAPQMMHMEDRLERLGSEFFNLKRAQDNDHVRKADKEEVQQLLARLTFFEKLNIPDLKIRIESLEGDTKFTAQNVSDISEKLYKVESVAVSRSELVKVQNGFEDLRSDHQVMKMELKELSATTYNSNRKFVHEMAEAKTWTQQAVVGLQKNKADHPDVAQLSEKVGKLESSIKDNRRILGDGGGQEINAVVRRIILNLEDKIMVLEKKIDAFADGRPKDISQSKGDMSPSHQQSASYQSTEMQEAAVQSISEELSVMTEAVSKLKQDISVSKVHIDEMTEQGHQNLELASRLHVLVQSTALEGMDDEGTALSLTRVQVMIAAAARQLVAGSKWITKETFDSRMEQIRGEYFKEIRIMQARLEEVFTKVQQAAPLQVNMQAVPAKLPKMIFQKVPSQGQATPVESEVDRLGTAPAGIRPQPMSARGLRPATEGRPRGRQGHQ